VTSVINTVLAVGATGSMGQVVVPELLSRGVRVRALVRDEVRAQALLPASVEYVVGDMATGDGLVEAVRGVDAIVFTHGGEVKEVDYDGVRRLLEVLDGATPRISLMTSIDVARATTAYNGLLNWKRRAERLVRAYGAPYTIVRPGWFEYQRPSENAVLMEQGDSTPVHVQRGVARSQIAKTLVSALFSDTAIGKTFELFAQEGELQSDWDELFGALELDDQNELAGGGDHGVALADEPAEVLADIAKLRG